MKTQRKKKKELNDKYSKLTEYLEVELSGLVEKVVISTLLTESPAALVQGAYGVSPSMQRYMKAQSVAAGSDAMNTGMMNKAILEINPNHSIVHDLDIMVRKDADNIRTKNFSMLLYDVARITSGYEISDSGHFAKRIMNLMTGEINTVEEAQIIKKSEEPDANEKVTNETDREVLKPEVLK